MERDRGLLYTISLNHFTNDGATNLISSLFPVMLVIFHLDYVQVGILVAVGLLVNVIVQPLVGRFADKVSSEKLMIAGMTLILASMLLFVIATDFYNLLLISVLLRAGSSFFHPVGLSRVSKVYTRAGADSAMGFMIAFGNVGVFTSFLIGGIIYDQLGWGSPFYVWAAITAVTVLITWTQLRKTQTSREKAEPSVQSESATTAKSPQAGGSTYRRLFALGRSTAFLIISSTVVSAAYAVFTSFGNLTLVGRGLDVVDANLGVALFAGVSMVGAFSLGRLRLSFSNAGLVATMTLVGILSYVVMTIVGSPAVDLAMFLIAGLSGSIAAVATLAMVADMVEAEVRGTFFGVLFAIQTLGAAGVTAVSGIAAEIYGLGAPYAIIALLSLPVVFWAATVRGTRGRFSNSA